MPKRRPTIPISVTAVDWRPDGLSHKEIEEIEHRECVREIEEDPFLGRVWARSKAGMDCHEAWRLTLAEELAKGRPWSQRLLEWAAEALLAQYEPKLKAQWERKYRPENDREVINALAERLKAKGVHNPRTEAESRWAKFQGVTPHALRQRRYRKK
jgi:alkylation response protein AidB-like acyl-CoA dehydrogenase